MKITCAIDGVGVRQRMQAKAATAIVEGEFAFKSGEDLETNPDDS
jgi:hypothetical protein